MSLLHLGIPISEEQCIGDSLSIINNSFEDLDTRTIQISNAVVLSSLNITTDLNNLEQQLKEVAQRLYVLYNK